jgi:hypothetical protein
MRISRLFKRLRRWSSQAFRKRHSPAAFRTCINAGNSVLTAEGPTSQGTGSISCEVEFCIFYRLILRTLQTKDVFVISITRYAYFSSPTQTDPHEAYKRNNNESCERNSLNEVELLRKLIVGWLVK